MAVVSTAYVLAAGLGTRLRPLTLERCKPLVEVCGTPLIEHVLGLLARAGVARVGINSHWLHPQLPQVLGARFRGMSL
ncbi:MAG TPA: sugar phosphate nucleotidyltransferase, partial [Myxococcota bacterium]